MDLERKDHLVELLDQFFKAVEGKAPCLVPFKEGYETHKLIDKLLGNI